MPVKITNVVATDKSVSTELLIDTIEKNRDRIRSSADMVLTLSGIVLSACFGFLLFFFERQSSMQVTIFLLIVASAFFLLAACLSAAGTFLRTNMPITNETQFVADLLFIFKRELKYVQLAMITVFIGLLIMSVGVLVMII